MKEGYLKENVKDLFINMKSIRHKELDFCVIQNKSTCQSNIKGFLTFTTIKYKRKNSLSVTRSVQAEDGKSVGRKP